MKELLTYPQIAKVLGVAEVTVRKWVMNKEIPFYKIGGAVRFDLEKVLSEKESLPQNKTRGGEKYNENSGQPGHADRAGHDHATKKWGA